MTKKTNQLVQQEATRNWNVLAMDGAPKNETDENKSKLGLELEDAPINLFDQRKGLGLRIPKKAHAPKVLKANNRKRSSSVTGPINSCTT